jgi:K+-sensing histidine kinase KdpD
MNMERGSPWPQSAYRLFMRRGPRLAAEREGSSGPSIEATMSDTIMAGTRAAASSPRIMPDDGGSLADELIHLPLVARHAASVGLVVLTTGVALAVERLAAPSNMALFFVVPVVLAATGFGWGASLTAVIAGVLAFDFFFTAPKYSFEIATASDLWAAGLLLVIAAIVSGVAAGARRGAEEARDDARRAEALRALAHKAIEGCPGEEIIQAASDTLSQIFRAPSVVFTQRDGALNLVARSRGARIFGDEESAAREVAESLVPARGEMYPFTHSAFDLWPVTTRAGVRYVIGVDFKHAADRRPSRPERSIEMVAACMAVAG